MATRIVQRPILIVLLTLLLGCDTDLHDRQLERIRSGESDTIYPHAPEVIDRILDDPAMVNRIRTIQFTDSDFSGDAYSRISELSRVREVVMYSTRNTDGVIQALTSLQSIEKLDFIETDLTDKGMASIRMPQLREMTIQFYGDQLSDSAISEVRLQNPNCEVSVSKMTE